LDDKIVRPGDFQRGVNERTSLNAIFELSQPIGRGTMIERYTDNDGEVGDEMSPAKQHPWWLRGHDNRGER
jgi:hypothetical protein